jgi:phage gp37-like protein
MKSTVIQFAEIVSAGWDKAIEAITGFVKLETRLENLQESFASKAHEAAKVLAFLQIEYAKKQDGDQLPEGTTFKDWFKNQFGRVPNNHHETLAGSYRQFVITGMMTEEHFDKASADALMAGYTAGKAVGWNTKDPNLVQVVELIKDRADGYAKNVKALKGQMQGKQVAKTDKEKALATVTHEMTDTEFAEIINTGINAGGMGTVFAAIRARIEKASSMTLEQAHALYTDTCNLLGAWEKSGLSPAVREEWSGGMTTKPARKPRREPVAA